MGETANELGREKHGPAGIVVEVVARDFGWRYRVLAPQADDGPLLIAAAQDELRLPANSDITLRITSEDYLCTFAVPQLNVRRLAVPEIVSQVELRTGATGRFEVAVDAMCGLKYLMEAKPGAIVVQPAPQFYDWMERCKLRGS